MIGDVKKYEKLSYNHIVLAQIWYPAKFQFLEFDQLQKVNN